MTTRMSCWQFVIFMSLTSVSLTKGLKPLSFILIILNLIFKLSDIFLI